MRFGAMRWSRRSILESADALVVSDLHSYYGLAYILDGSLEPWLRLSV